MPRWRNVDALVLETSIFGYVSSCLTWGTNINRKIMKKTKSKEIKKELERQQVIQDLVNLEEKDIKRFSEFAKTLIKK